MAHFEETQALSIALFVTVMNRGRHESHDRVPDGAALVVCRARAGFQGAAADVMCLQVASYRCTHAVDAVVRHRKSRRGCFWRR